MTESQPLPPPTPPEPTAPEGPAFPTATLVEDLRQTRLWLLPLLAGLLLVTLGIRSAWRAPVIITVRFQEGHGIKLGDAVRFRGIQVGKVAAVALSPDLQEVRLELELDPGLRRLAAQGTTLWIVHPRAGLYGIQGLDTLIGPRYVGISPGQGAFQSEFIGLEDQPPSENLEGGLEIVLQAPSRGSLRAGAPVHYRDLPVGSVTSVGLAPDSVSVEIRVLIESRFAGLVRDNTRFWNASGLALDFGLLKGFSLDMESLQTLFAGGICLATPDASGALVQQGHRFPLHPKPEAEWLAWHPALWLGDDLLPPGAAIPATVRVQASWVEKRLGGLWKEKRLRRGWALPLAGGLLCPADLCVVPGDPDQKPSLEALGRTWAVPSRREWPSSQLAFLAGTSQPNPWPADGLRRPAAPEDCCAVSDSHSSPLPLQANRLRVIPDGDWLVDPSVGLPLPWHGAVVLSRRDGKVLGLLQVRGGEPARVSLVPEKMP